VKNPGFCIGMLKKLMHSRATFNMIRSRSYAFQN